MPVKGFEEGVRAWGGGARIVGRLAVRGAEVRRGAQRDHRSRRRTGDVVRGVVGDARRTGAGVCLVGDAGMGNRGSHERSWSARRATGPRARNRCAPSSGNSPLLPIGVLLRRTAGIRVGASDSGKEAAGKQLLEGLVPDGETAEAWSYMAPLFGVESAPIPLDKTREQVRAATIATIVRMVQALARQQPLALLCEDLHWADDSTAQVVQSIAAAVRGVSALIVVTRWPRAVTPIDLDGVTAEFTTIAIEPLSESNAAELVRAVAGDELPPERVDAIVSRCGGVPLLLEEVTRSTSRQAEPASLRSQRAYSSVPAGTTAHRRVATRTLAATQRDYQAASVLGGSFPFPCSKRCCRDGGRSCPRRFRPSSNTGCYAPPHPAPARAFKSRDDPRRRVRDSGQQRLPPAPAFPRRGYFDGGIRRDGRTQHSTCSRSTCRRRRGFPKPSGFTWRLAKRRSSGLPISKRKATAIHRRLLDRVSDRASLRNDEFQAHVLRGMVATGIDGYSAQSAEAAYRTAQMMFDDSTDPALRYPVLRGLATATLVRGDLATAYQYSQEGLRACRAIRSRGLPDRRDERPRIHHALFRSPGGCPHTG